MVKVSVESALRDFPSLLRRVEQGEAFYLVQADRIVAELKPVAAPAIGLRPQGLAAGDFIVPDDFDAPLPEEVLRSFEGK